MESLLVSGNVTKAVGLLVTARKELRALTESEAATVATTRVAVERAVVDLAMWRDARGGDDQLADIAAVMFKPVLEILAVAEGMKNRPASDDEWDRISEQLSLYDVRGGVVVCAVGKP